MFGLTLIQEPEEQALSLTQKTQQAGHHPTCRLKSKDFLFRWLFQLATLIMK